MVGAAMLLGACAELGKARDTRLDPGAPRPSLDVRPR
jgi:hypothetical protein